MLVLHSIFLRSVIVVGACQPFLFCSRMFNRLLLRSNFMRGNLLFEAGRSFGCLGLGMLLGRHYTGVLGRLMLRDSIVLRCQPLYCSRMRFLCPLQLLRMLVLQSLFLSTVIVVSACQSFLLCRRMLNRLLPRSDLVRRDLLFKAGHNGLVPFGGRRLGLLLGGDRT